LALEVFDPNGGAALLDKRVTPGQGPVVEVEITLGVATDGHRRTLEGYPQDLLAAVIDDDFCHGRPPLVTSGVTL
jgi:hypothetical protein